MLELDHSGNAHRIFLLVGTEERQLMAEKHELEIERMKCMGKRTRQRQEGGRNWESLSS